MSFQLKFTTQDYNQGKSILIVDASTGTFPAISAATYTITSLYSGTVLSPSTAVKTITATLVAGFQHEITNVDLGFNADDTIPDSVYNIVMTVTGTADTYTSEEVVYYNAKYTRDNFIASKAAYIDNVNDQDMEYANWLDFLITSIESNSIVGNSSAIYYVFDIFRRLNNV
jgi:hypothetical protein